MKMYILLLAYVIIIVLLTYMMDLLLIPELFQWQAVMELCHSNDVLTNKQFSSIGKFDELTDDISTFLIDSNEDYILDALYRIMHEPWFIHM